MKGGRFFMVSTLTVTLTGLLLQGPAVVRFETATTIARGFRSIDVANSLGPPPNTLTSIYTTQEFGLWNGCSFTLAENQSFTIPASLLPASGRYRLWVDGQCRTAPDGNAGFLPGDINLDGFLNPLDYNLYTNWFESGDPQADFNGDGFLDPLDYNLFLNTFEMQ